MIKRKRISDEKEVKIIAAAIYDDGFLLDFSDIYQPGLFTDPKSDRILGWCLSYFELYERAPGIHIQDLFLKEVESEAFSEEEATMLSKVLKKAEGIASKGIQKDFVLDKAKEYFQKKALETLTKKIENTDVSSALKEVEDFRVPETVSTYILPFSKPELFKEAVNKKTVPIFRVPGALGEMMNPYLTRNSFIGFLAPEKRGKTWWLFELAIRAFQCRNNVALFQVGDMSEDQGLRRIAHRLCGKPIYEHQIGPCLVPIIDCRDNQNGSCPSVNRMNKHIITDEADDKLPWEEAPKRYKPCTYCLHKGLKFPKETWFKEIQVKDILQDVDIEKAAKKMRSRSKGKEFRLSTHPNSSVSIMDINKILKRWKRGGWVPDVVIIDYADILAADPGYKELRHQENEKWKGMRRLSQIYDCCLITATQADAASYSEEDLALSNFSEDKRKYGHVTAMYAINQNQKDKSEKVQRIATLILREGEFNTMHQVKVLQCLTLGKPYVDSYWFFSAPTDLK